MDRSDPKSGFNSTTRTFHSLRPPLDLPPYETPMSAAEYALALHSQHSPLPDSVALINSATGGKLYYSEFISRVKALASHLQNVTKLSQNDTAFVLAPNSIQVPILYLSLLSIGVVISPGNPVSTEPEISRQIQLCKPVVAFATSAAAHKLPALKHPTILIDSDGFDSMMMTRMGPATGELSRVRVRQSDVAAILYSSGTTGKVKGVMLTHRNLMAAFAGPYSVDEQKTMNSFSPRVTLCTVPYFHVYGFFYSLKSVAFNEAVVVMERFDLKKMFRAVEEFKVTHTAVVPPVVVAMAKNTLDTDGYDLRSIRELACGGAPLGKDVIAAFTARFPAVELWQGYGLTESTGRLSRPEGPEENLRWGSVGKISGSFEARIIDPDTGAALPPGKQGELWIRGPTVMKGYVGDSEATSSTLRLDGWLRTGDLCYIDEEGFLYVVDRLKDLIKYKGYQVPPAELEQLLRSHPEIAEAAVVPYPDAEAGEVPLAFVVKQPQSRVKESDVMDFIAKQVAPYKKIRRVAFVSSIPKSPAGKILRKDLRMIAIPGRGIESRM